MLSDLTDKVPVYLVTGYTDLRRSIDGLAIIVQAQLRLDPFSKALFLFCGRRCDRIKCLLGRETDSYCCTSGLTTEEFNGRGTKLKHCC